MSRSYALRLQTLAIVALLSSGRSNAGTPELGDIVELVRASSSDETRVLLTSAGAVRVDYKASTREGRRSRTILMPGINAREVSSVAKAIASLVDQSVDILPVPWVRPEAQEQSIIIRCRLARDGKVRTAKMLQRDFANNLVWNGVIDEVEMVSDVKLAAAIDAFYCGEARECPFDS